MISTVFGPAHIAPGLSGPALEVPHPGEQPTPISPPQTPEVPDPAPPPSPETPPEQPTPVVPPEPAPPQPDPLPDTGDARPRRR
ncbi:MAG: hypothetical protein MSC31_02060 [Solirubrobacteraceae bacterium MAG38_C4-C5]|nr:hypothetical protein [Candidatus Siliceabacter maunaloa]